MAKDYLTGRIVFVDTTCFSDSQQRPGEIGKVVNICNQDKDVLTIEFEDGTRNAYRAEYLKTLAPKKMMLDSVIDHQHRFVKEASFKDMLNVYKLATQNRVKEALKLAILNSNTRFYCAINCKDYREIKEDARKYQVKGKKRNM